MYKRQTWDVAMFTNWSLYSSGGAFTCFDKDAYTVRPCTELTVTSRAYGTTFKDGDFYDFENLDVYLYSDSWEQLDMLKDAGSGKATFTFTVPKDEGTYYIVGFDPNRKIPTDDSGGTNYAKIAPATAILTVSGTDVYKRQGEHHGFHPGRHGTLRGGGQRRDRHRLHGMHRQL